MNINRHFYCQFLPVVLLTIAFVLGFTCCKTNRTKNFEQDNESIIESQKSTSLNNFYMDKANGNCYYIPTHAVDVKLSLVLMFDPHARGDVSIQKYLEIAESNKFILAASLVSQNGMSMEKITSHVKSLLDTLLKNLPIDKSMVVFVGFSGGGRVASEMARTFPYVNGVISCGAANPILKREGLRYSIICGNEDFNFIECASIATKEISNTGFSLFEFDGIHEWPSSKIMKQAIDFCMGKSSSVRSVNLSEELLVYLNTENRIRNELIGSFATKELGWWTATIDQLRLDSMSANILDSKSSKRLLAYIGMICYSFTQRAINMNDPELTNYCLKIYEYIEPENEDLKKFKEQYLTMANK